MFKMSVRDHIMIAHSLPAEYFGPAQGMHGATYVVDCIFESKKLNEYNVVMDMGRAHDVLKKVLTSYSYKNLDELERFKGILTTTEKLAEFIFQDIKAEISNEFEGSLEVKLNESHVAWASYTGQI